MTAIQSIIDGALWTNPGAKYSLMSLQDFAGDVEFLFVWFEESANVKVERFRNGRCAGDEDLTKGAARLLYKELLDAGLKVVARGDGS
ncbi:unnamed protein product [marine sediment metagenome]|uniref:Uncharacterized protein n=1 Tax=marine sediment metagenome TaxID=412755 RepID=X0VAF2_9ZZZZ